MRRIADSANITVGNIYRYFENKEALFNAVLAPAQRAIDDLESFDKTLHITQIETKKEANAPVTYVMNLLRPYTRAIFILIFNSQVPPHQNVKIQLERLVIGKIKENYPGVFQDYFLKVVASSFIQALFVVFRENINDIKKIQDMLVQLVVFYFRDVNNRLF